LDLAQQVRLPAQIQYHRFLEIRMQTWHRYVALGDSFTEGVGDSVDGFAKLGAMDRLAAAFRQSSPGLQFTNLAKSGLLVSEVREQQLETALALEPDFVTLVAGANDILKGRFNAAGWEQEFQILFEALARSGAVVVTGGVPNFPLLKTLKESHQVGMTRIISKANNIMRRVSDRYQVIYIDSWSISALSNQEDWSLDGVHLNSRGYFKFAQEIIQVLEQRLGLRLGVIETP
jgi:lysophospholipase L1-like esterase